MVILRIGMSPITLLDHLFTVILKFILLTEWHICISIHFALYNDYKDWIIYVTFGRLFLQKKLQSGSLKSIKMTRFMMLNYNHFSNMCSAIAFIHSSHAKNPKIKMWKISLFFVRFFFSKKCISTKKIQLWLIWYN